MRVLFVVEFTDTFKVRVMKKVLRFKMCLCRVCGHKKFVPSVTSRVRLHNVSISANVPYFSPSTRVREANNTKTSDTLFGPKRNEYSEKFWIIQN